jgi:hypothetical protein
MPDTIIGMGMAGKSVVYNMFDRDWVLDEILEERSGTVEDVSAYVVDTAVDEQKQDQVTVDRLNDRIRSRAEALGRSPTNVWTEVEYVNPLEDTDKMYTTRAGLTAEGTVKEIASGAGLNAWWIGSNTDETMLSELNDYKEGVIRRRALSKALFDASWANNSKLKQVVRQAEGDVYIVVGLGGGTGSGMFLDVAKRLAGESEAGRVHLFGVAPGRSESTDIRANAHAVLSELEYLNLTGDDGSKSPFDNVVLFPFGPVVADNISMDEFYDGIVQSIIAHQNMESNMVDSMNTSNLRGPHKYAPFVVAVPQILRYAVADTQDAKDAVEAYIEAKDEALETEHALYEAVTDYVLREFEGEDAARDLEAVVSGGVPRNELFNLDTDEANDLHGRLEEFRTVLGQDVFDQLDYTPALEWKQTLAQRERQIRDRNETMKDAELRKEIVTEVPATATSGLEPVEQQYSGEEILRRLERTIRRELRAIKRRADLIRAIHLVEDEDLRTGLRAALDEDIDSAMTVPEVKHTQGSVSNDIEDLEEQLAGLERFDGEELAPRIERRLEEWRTSVEADVARLVSLDDNADHIQRLLTALDDAIDDAITHINEAERVDDLDPTPFTFADFDELNHRLREVGLGEVDASKLRSNLNDGLRETKAYWLKKEEVESSTFKRFLKGTGDLEDEYSYTVASLDNDLVSLTDFDEEFDCAFIGPDFAAQATDLTEERQELLTRIEESYRSALNDIGVKASTMAEFLDVDVIADHLPEWTPRVTWPGDVSEYPARLRAELEDDVSDRTADALLDRLCASGASAGREPGVVYAGFDAAYREPVADVEARIAGRLEELRAQQRRYDDLRELIDEDGARFARSGTGPKELDTTFEAPLRDRYTYTKHVPPGGDQSLLRYDDIGEANLWETNERRNMLRSLEEFARNVASADERLPLLSRTIQGDPSRYEGSMANPQYDQHRIKTVFMSPMFETGATPAGLDRVEDKLRANIWTPAGSDGYERHCVGFGGPWDLSMVTFVGGVLLDNISVVSGDSGYRARYLKQKESLEEGVIVRHTHGIDGKDADLCTYGRGAYLVRRDLLDVNDVHDRNRLIASNEGELRRHLLDNYVEVTDFESTVDIVGVQSTDAEREAGGVDTDGPGTVDRDDAGAERGGVGERSAAGDGNETGGASGSDGPDAGDADVEGPGAVDRDDVDTGSDEAGTADDRP